MSSERQEIPVRARVRRRFRRNDAATLSVESEVVVVEATDGRVLFSHGRFDTALGWLDEPGPGRRFRLSSTCDDQLSLAVDSDHVNEIREIERWLHLDG